MAWPNLGGTRSLLMRAVRSTEWSYLVDYISPAFFDVVPLSALLAQGRELTTNATGRHFDKIREESAELLERCRIDAALIAADAVPENARFANAAELTEAERRDVGQRALEIYFAQVYATDRVILDLRAACFAVTDDARVLWSPRPMWAQWDPSFLHGVRDLYTGFYRDDDDAFARGVAQLDLGEAGDVLRDHFGEGDQRAVEFRMDVFQSTFHAAFVRCRDSDIRLHRNFLVLGLYLACLYDLLESLDLPFDVRDAFDRVTSGP